MTTPCTGCGGDLAATAVGDPCPTCGTPNGEAPPLEVDAEWTAAREAKQAAAAALPPKARKRGAWVLTIVMLVMLGVIIVMIQQRQPTARGVDTSGTVEITITAPRPVPVTIDGVKSGTTPLSIRLRGRTHALRIEGNGVVREVSPSRDQVVNLVKP